MKWMGYVVGGVLLTVSSAWAEQIPDETTPCYKTCETVRLQCRSTCKQANHQEKSALYACLDACDPPFNETCVPACPTKAND